MKSAQVGDPSGSAGFGDDFAEWKSRDGEAWVGVTDSRCDTSKYGACFDGDCEGVCGPECVSSMVIKGGVEPPDPRLGGFMLCCDSNGRLS